MFKNKKALEFVIFFSLIQILSGCMNKSQEEKLYDICIEKVPPLLKAPATAVFSTFEDTYIKQKIKTYPNDGIIRATWTVEGHVDSQNSYGALLRTEFSCKFKQYKEDIKFDKAVI